MSHTQLVDTEGTLAEVVQRLSRAGRVAVDIESNGFFRYQERVCLVQLAADDTAFIVDPLPMKDLGPLGKLLADPSVEKVFHGCDYDLRSLDRDWGFRVDNLFDTSVAAALVGSAQLGLQSVLQQFAGVELTKQRRLQRSDWTLRPLSPEALRYAADDVLHLPRAREALGARLRELSRLDWAEEEFARLQRVRHTPSDREAAFLGIKGSRDLDGRGLAVLRSLCQFREREARRIDRPLFKVMPDSALLQLADAPDADLATVKGLGRFARPPASRGLKAAIQEGLRSPPLSWPKRTRSDDALSPEERKRAVAHLQSLKAWRTQVAQDLGLNPGLLWPASSLERLARCLDSLDAEMSSPEVRGWQQRQFGAALRGVLATLA